MKKYALVILIGCTVFIQVNAQSIKLQDSLEYYYLAGQFEKAVPIAERLVVEIKASFGANHSEYAKSLIRLGMLLQTTNRFFEAEPLFLEAVSIFKSKQFSDDPAYNQLFDLLSARFKMTGDKDIITDICGQFLEHYKSKADTDRRYFPALSQVAGIYRDMGMFKESLIMYEEMIKWIRSYINMNSKEGQELYALSLSLLGQNYYITGNYNKAESAFTESLEFAERLWTKTDPRYITTLLATSSFYASAGNTPKVLDIRNEAFELLKKVQTADSLPFALALNTLGVLYITTGDYNKAVLLLRESLDIWSRSREADSSVYALRLGSLAVPYMKLGNYKTADSLLEKALAIANRSFEPESAGGIALMINTISLYSIQQKYEMILPLWKGVLPMAKRVFGESESFLDIMLKATCDYFMMGDTTMAINLAVEMLDLNTKYLSQNLDFMPEEELLMLIKKQESLSLYPISNGIAMKNNELAKSLFNSSVLIKGLAIQNMSKLQQEMQYTKDATLRETWQEYLHNKYMYSQLLSGKSKLAGIGITTGQLEKEILEQEKELLRKSATLRDVKTKINTSWKEVVDQLKPHEAAIEFIRYEQWDKTWSDSFHYAAMLLRYGDTVPLIILLCDEKKLAELVDHYANGSSLKNATDESGNKLNKQLTNTIWMPLETYLPNTSTIYFAPAGLLYRIAISALPLRGDTLLTDRYQLVQLSSVRELLDKKPPVVKSFSIALFGGIDYNSQRTDSNIRANTNYPFYRGSGKSHWKDLSETLPEINFISKKFKEKQHTSIYYYQGQHASESAFREASSRAPAIIHIATHGFAFPEPVIHKSDFENTSINPFDVSKNPLLRCGLVMAGGNRGWDGTSPIDQDDGILTALEIATQHLYNTDLVVLSACSAGGGELLGAEGVFGLQRALKKAGVRYVIAPLWRIPDLETTIFMEYFYANLLKSKNIQQSFTQAQHTMKAKNYPAYYWAAFTLVK